MKTIQNIFLGLMIASSLLLTIGCNLTGPDDDENGGETTPTAVAFESAVQTGGSSGTADSTGLTLTFDVDPTTLAASDITVTGATKGALSGTGTTRSLGISDITVDNEDTVSVATASPSGFTISGSPKTAVVYRVYIVGDDGPAGGKIFYDKGSYSDGWRYLEAWTADESGTYSWKESNTNTGGTSTAIGTGYANTYTCMTGAGSYAHPAAEVVKNATYGDKNDWFLPSKDELSEAYGTNVFTNTDYWSSSEKDSNNAYYRNPSSTTGSDGGKATELRVRAVRAF